MKGLLLKEWYMVTKYCRAYLFIIILFTGMSFLHNGNLFFIFYPCIFTGIIPTTLLAYDERSKWDEYSQTMPYSKAQLVSAKYLIGLLIQMAVLVLLGIIQAIRMNMDGTFTFESYFVLIAMLLIITCIVPAINLPLMFKFGVEKGRIAYYLAICVCAIGVVLISKNFTSYSNFQSSISLTSLFLIICLVAILIYIFSWYLSIVFYKKREIA